MVPLGQAVATGLLAVLGAPGWVLLGVIVISLVPMLTLIAHAVRANFICTRQAAGVRAALEKYQPQFAVSTGHRWAPGISSACGCRISSG